MEGNTMETVLLHNLIDGVFNGFGYEEWVLLANRLAIGFFFAISGWYKLTNPVRHQSLVDTLKECGIPWIGFCQWFVPGVELLAGTAIIFGIAPGLAGSGIMAILLVAWATDGPRRIREFCPISRADYLDDALYISETAYIFMTAFLLSQGPGALSLNWFFEPLVRSFL